VLGIAASPTTAEDGFPWMTAASVVALLGLVLGGVLLLVRRQRA
jgi:hypothetical protein